jgi:hypothetical protein
MITQKPAAGTVASMQAAEIAPARVPGVASARMKARGISFEGHFHAGMAWLFVIVAVTGFAPRSFAIVTGKMAIPPLVVHLHAAVMASWVVLLAIQATLSLTGRMDLHRRWGRAALVVAPLVLIMLIVVTVVRQNDAAGTPGAPVVNNILFLQIRSILLFPTFCIWGLLTRRTDPQTHKRMMLLATLMLLDAAIARMGWLPYNEFPRGYSAVHAYLLLLLVPALLYDLLRLGRIHRAWVWGLALVLPWVIATEFVWGSPWWRGFGPKLVGAG